MKSTGPSRSSTSAGSETGCGQEGYRGFFEVDVLVDLDSDRVYLGELNPRISGASSITNVTAGAYADIPLFLFHLLEFMDVDYEVDVDEINERWRELAAVDVWAQLIMKETVDSVERILEAPRTGTWHLEDDGSLRFVMVTRDWHDITHEDECFFLRVLMGRATTASREQISVSSLPRAGCRPFRLYPAVPAVHRRRPVAVRQRKAAGDSDSRSDRVRQVGAPSRGGTATTLGHPCPRS